MAITQQEADNIEQEFLDALSIGEEGNAKAAKKGMGSPCEDYGT